MTEMFWEAFPTYLSYGMTFELYWHGPVMAAAAYREAFQIRAEQKNEELWMQGVYVYEAFASIVSKLTKGKSLDYPIKPHNITPVSTIDEAEQKKLKAEAERKKMIRMLNAMKSSWDANHERRRS